ncbi:hypothetical protein [Streptomyces sp. NPDC058644]|uniref:hypothetical protein n=1 Tax=unclassified Streptomyces TaxID=2593676 RepID=UPI003658EF24
MAGAARPTFHGAVRVRNLRRTVHLPLAVAALVVTAACSSGSGEGKATESPARASPSKSADTTETKAREAALSALSGMRTEQTKAYAKGKASGTTLSSYARDKAQAKIESELFQYRQAAIKFTGKPTSTAKAKAVDVESSPHKATIKECLDTSKWDAVKHGKVVTSPNQVRR